MKRDTVRRFVLGGLVALTVSGASLGTFAAGNASAATAPTPSGMSSTNEYVCERIQGRWFCYEL